MAIKPATAKEIDTLRTEISRCIDEIAWLNEAPMPQDELKARATECCQEMARRFDAPGHLGRLANPTAGFSEMMSMFRMSAKVYILGKPDVTTADSDDLGSAVAWIMGDALTQRMHAEIDRLDYRPGLPMPERPARLTELKATMRTLEQREEGIICRAEETGVFIPRRADADPAVILNFDPKGRIADPQYARHAKLRVAWDGNDSGLDTATGASPPTDNPRSSDHG